MTATHVMKRCQLKMEALGLAVAAITRRDDAVYDIFFVTSDSYVLLVRCGDTLTPSDEQDVARQLSQGDAHASALVSAQPSAATTTWSVEEFEKNAATLVAALKDAHRGPAN